MWKSFLMVVLFALSTASSTGSGAPAAEPESWECHSGAGSGNTLLKIGYGRYRGEAEEDACTDDDGETLPSCYIIACYDNTVRPTRPPTAKDLCVKTCLSKANKHDPIVIHACSLQCL